MYHHHLLHLPHEDHYPEECPFVGVKAFQAEVAAQLQIYHPSPPSPQRNLALQSHLLELSISFWVALWILPGHPLFGTSPFSFSRTSATAPATAPATFARRWGFHRLGGHFNLHLTHGTWSILFPPGLLRHALILN